MKYKYRNSTLQNKRMHHTLGYLNGCSKTIVTSMANGIFVVLVFLVERRTRDSRATTHNKCNKSTKHILCVIDRALVCNNSH